ncbi:hypothetical protein [Reyranella sp.]|uniref:hypothetical protein n=2 Tax=Reyranella sp. TaxID=1929291 RepID=UPI0040369C88
MLRAGGMLVAAIAGGLATSGCSDPFRSLPSSPASPAATKAALNLEKPPADRARLIVFNGGRIDGDGNYRPRNYSIRLSVNEVRIGSMNPGQAMIFDVAPGQYSFAWEPIDGKALLQKIAPATQTLAAGELLPLQTDVDGYALKINQGYERKQIVTNAQTGRQQINPDIEIAQPTTCPPAICLPVR